MRQASFRCLTCHTIISNTAVGTKHRNHCPFCLWSRHVDLKIPGDRRSPCGARMKPIGLTFKNVKTNPFTDRTSGELMIVHLCLNCGKISCNRIAGDDNSYAIISLLDNSTKLSSRGVRLLTQKDKQEVLIALYGYGYQKY